MKRIVISLLASAILLSLFSTVASADGPRDQARLAKVCGNTNSNPPFCVKGSHHE